MKSQLPLLLSLLTCGSALLHSSELNRNTIYRGSLQNSRIQFEKHKSGRVAFIGGSITQMEGYRPILGGWLKERFPETEFEFVNAGISSTCSTTGAFRLREHVLSKGRIDLFFVEFAVNDDQDAGHTHQACVRGLEGILRQARTLQPHMDIIGTHFVNPAMLKTLQDGRMPLSMAAHEQVLQHYGVSTNFLARELADRIQAGTMDWKTFGGTHPKKPGNTLAAEGAIRILEAAWQSPLPAKARRSAHRIPAEALDAGSYYNARFLSPALATLDQGFSYFEPDWKKIPGGFRNTFAGMKLLCAEKVESEAVLKFEGRTLGAFVLAGPDAGIVEVSIDGGKPKLVDLYHSYSRGLHYPRTVILTTDIEPGEHTARIRIAKQRNPQSKGTAARILQFGAN